MSNKIRSKSLFKSQEIDPNKLSINFNKRNQIGFQLKLLENLRNSKKTFEKYDENKSEIQNYQIIKDDNKKSNKIKFPLELSNNEINSNDNSEYLISDSLISNNEGLNKDIINNNQKKTNNIFLKLINDIDSLVDISSDLSKFVNIKYPLMEETKLLDVWLDLEDNKDYRQYKSLFLKTMFIINKHFKEERQILTIEIANKIYYRIIKFIILVSVLCLFVIIYIGIDSGIIKNIKKLISLTSKCFLNFYEIFNIKKLSNANEILIEKFNKINIKGYKIESIHLKSRDLIQYLNKECDYIGMGIKQFLK